MNSSLMAQGQFKCEDCPGSCEDGCSDRKPYSYGSGRVIRATYERDAYADAGRIADDDVYAREVLAREDRLITKYGNWILSFKAAPYGDRDFMAFIENTDGRRVEGLNDLSDKDMQDFLGMMEKLKVKFEKEYPDSHFVVGINRGSNQSLKRIHFHITDISEAVEPQHDDEIGHVRDRVASRTRPFRATMYASDYVFQIAKDAYIEGGVIKVPLTEDIIDNMITLRMLADSFEDVLRELNSLWGDKEIWSYSMLFDKNAEGKEVLSIAFFDRPIGCTDIAGVALNRKEGITSPEVEDIRDDLSRVVKEALAISG